MVDFVPILLLLAILLWICYHVLTSIFRPRRAANLPPGPPQFPIVGNIFQLGQNPHQTLAQLSKTYGPLMHLKLGSMDTIAVSSPELARQVLQKHDQALSSRVHQAVSDAYGHNKVSVVWMPANARWRALRKICKDQMFSLQRLDSGQGLRREKLEKLRDYVQECSDGCRVLDIADAAFTTSFNVISATVFSVDFCQFHSDSSRELKRIVRGLIRALGTPNLADYFPVLKPIDPQGALRKAVSYVGKFFGIIDVLIDQRLRSAASGAASVDSETNNDLLVALLDISRRNESELSREDIRHLLLDLFVAGSDTTATTVEWAMAELIHNPKKMAKARNELQTVVGEIGQVEESDISRLPYLQAVLKETFRLHPAVPLLVPRKAEADTEINGFLVPRNAQILVNVWASGRNPGVWSDPDSFEPERFLDSKMDIRGQDFGLIPFGSGRRICPGLPLAYRMVHLVVATMIRNFDWRPEGGIMTEEMNMEEKFEFTLQRAVPLKAIPVRL